MLWNPINGWLLASLTGSAARPRRALRSALSIGCIAYGLLAFTRRATTSRAAARRSPNTAALTLTHHAVTSYTATGSASPFNSASPIDVKLKPFEIDCVAGVLLDPILALSTSSAVGDVGLQGHFVF